MAVSDQSWIVALFVLSDGTVRAAQSPSTGGQVKRCVEDLWLGRTFRSALLSGPWPTVEDLDPEMFSNTKRSDGGVRDLRSMTASIRAAIAATRPGY